MPATPSKRSWCGSRYAWGMLLAVLLAYAAGWGSHAWRARLTSQVTQASATAPARTPKPAPSPTLVPLPTAPGAYRVVVGDEPHVVLTLEQPRPRRGSVEEGMQIDALEMRERQRHMITPPSPTSSP